MNTSVNLDELNCLINGDHKDPYNILGMHKVSLGGQQQKALSVRAFLPNASKIKVIDIQAGTDYPMEKVHGSGFFEAMTDREDFFSYRLEVTDHEGNAFSTHDPYSFLPVISDYDIHLFKEGNHHRIYEKLGSHLCDVNGVTGALFSVWAPCARRVSVVGDFNQWDGRRHQMRNIGYSGIWEIFIPGLAEGDIYKYEIKTPTGELYKKSDPYAFHSELRPDTASKVYDLNGYAWHDEAWVKERASGSTLDKPVSIYEVHLGSWKKKIDEDDNGFFSYVELADLLVDYVKDMGYTHIEILPISEHPFDGSWGYQVTGYYAATSRYGSPKDFMYFVDKFHQNGIGVIMDWVPAHFPKDGHGLARFDGTALYEHYDAKQGEHPDWGTHIFNYGRNEVRNFLVSNAVFWFEKYHIDGLRVDAVASMLHLDYNKKQGEWIPNKYGGRENLEAVDFVRQLNQTVYQYYPGVMMIAEESTSWPMVTKPPYMGGLGFSYKWNMGWMNDFLKYVSMDPIYRKHHHNLLTFSIMYAYSENFMQVLSHDEVVHGKFSMLSKMPGDYWQKFAGLRNAYGYMYGHPGKKLMFMGNEFGQFIEWKYKTGLDWLLLDYDMHKKMQNYVRDLNNLYKSEKALYEVDFSYEGFQWLDCNDADHSIVSFLRKGKRPQDMLIFVCNFTPVVHDHYRIGVPFDTYYMEVLNSDSEVYGGSNVGNCGGLQAEQVPVHGKPFSLGMRIPPLATVVLKPRLEKEA